MALRAKLYSLKIQEQEAIKKAKGVKTGVVKKKIFFEDYVDCLFNLKEMRVYQNNIRSRRHIVRTEKQEKIAVSPFDTKRYICDDQISTLAWGHFKIPKEIEDLSNMGENNTIMAENGYESLEMFSQQEDHKIEEEEEDDDVQIVFEREGEALKTVFKQEPEDSDPILVIDLDQDESPPSKKPRC